MLITGQPIMVIAVMGVTGAGKSTFVRAASGNDEVVVGHSLEACTRQIAALEFNYNGHNIILVDTPGFNDTYRSDTEVLLDLAKWLEVTYRQNAKLTGIIYLHRITDVRMDGSGMRNLKLFRKLCGDSPMKNVVIASTFWGQIIEAKAVAHEDELRSKPNFWGSMIEHGAEVRRFEGTHESAIAILMSFASKATVTLDIQRELVDEKKPLGETAAGNAVNEELHRLEAKYREELDRIQQETVAALAENDVKYERILRTEREQMQEKLERIHVDQDRLRQERREEIRRIEGENRRKFNSLKKEYDNKLERQQLEGDRLRDDARADMREQMREMRLQQARLSAGFQGQIQEMQEQNEQQMQYIVSENESLRAASVAAQKNRDNDVGGKLATLMATGVAAVLDPFAIPVALAALADFVSEF